MDEYLFIEMAKLQADRRKLEREQREAQRPHGEPSAAQEKRREPARKAWFSPEWRQQS